MKSKLLFVTSNENKCREVQEILQCPIKMVDVDLEEVQTTDLNTLIRHKANQAYAHVQVPVLVEDTSLYFHAWNGLPGPLIKWFLKSMGTENLVKALSSFQNKSAEAITCLGFADGNQVHLFEGKISGTIVPPRGENGFGWDTIFQPDGYDLSFAEMASEQKSAISMRKQAVAQLEIFLRGR